MDYKVVILTAGIGKRVGNFSDVLNKALLPINHKPIICQIIDKFPEDVEIVIALGHKKETVKTFLDASYSRSFTYVEVDKYTGEGTGPGYSLLQCKKYLQCPFIYYSVDTIVVEDVPTPDKSWWGVAEVEDTLRFCSCKVDGEGKIIQIDDKTKNDNTLAFIGLAGIKEHEIFWEALESNNALIQGELQVSNGFNALKDKGLLFTKQFTWFDSGTEEEYRATQKYFMNHHEKYGKEFK